MDKFPVCWKERAVGELTVEKEALYTWFAARVALPREDLWSAWAIGTGGELRLGVLEPEDGGAMIRRRFSDRMIAPIGKLLRGEIRPAVKNMQSWEAVLRPETLFRTPNLSKYLGGQNGILKKETDSGFLVAFPYDKGKTFPLADLFCFADLCVMDGRTYVKFSFNREEEIVFCQGE